MRSSSSLRRRTEEGQILAIVAGGFIALVAIVALVLEGGTLLLNRRDAQNTADVASMAGTRIVALRYTQADPITYDQSAVYDAIEATAGVNNCAGAGGTPCTWSAAFVGNSGGTLTELGPVTDTSTAIPSSSLGVKVGVTRQPQAFFGRAIGFAAWSVSTDATAMTTSGGSFPAGVLLPIAFCGWQDPSPNDCGQATGPAPGNSYNFQPGQIVALTDGKDAPGGFGWLSWTGSNSAGALADSICNPNNPAFSLDSPFDSPGAPIGNLFGTHPGDGETWFPIDPGKSNSSSVRACLDGWIEAGVERGTQVLVPIYDLVEGNGNNAQYHVTGIAAVILQSRDQPAVDNIEAVFVEYYSLTEVPGGIGTNPPIPGQPSSQIGLVR
jgi:Flp pilus assembly protein TadG